MEHYCNTHNCKFYRNEKNGRVWYSHKIKGEDGYCNENFDTEHPVNPLVEEAKKLGAVPVNEIRKDGYVPAETPKPPSNAPQSISKPVKIEMSKDDWAEKDRITRKSIERQKALELALTFPLPSDTIEDVIECAKRFELYLEKGE